MFREGFLESAMEIYKDESVSFFFLNYVFIWLVMV